jgi:hypothetical protein
MTLEDLRQAVYAECGYPTTAETRVVTRITAWLNEGQRRILRNPSMSDLRQGTITFSSIAGQAVYGVPQAFERLDALVDQTTGGKLQWMSRQQFRLIDPAERSSGTPYYYVPEGLEPAFRQPRTTNVLGTGVWAVSSSAADTTQKVNFQGMTVGPGDVPADMRAPVQITLNGTTRVQIGSVTTYGIIVSWNLDSASAGQVVLFDAAVAGNVLAYVNPGFKSVQYQMIRLWPTPAAVLPYALDGQFLIQDMVQATDVPMLPPSYHDLLTDYARMREYDRTGDKRLAFAAQQYTDGLAKLRTYVQFPPGYNPVAGTQESTIRRNNLGGAYPADYSWP